MYAETLGFKELYPHEKGFGTYFQKEIVPFLFELEDTRIRTLRYVRIVTVVSYAMIAIYAYRYFTVGAGHFGLNEDTIIGLIFMSLIGAVPGALIRAHFVYKHKHLLMPLIMKFFPDAVYKGKEYFDPSLLREFEIVPSFNRDKGSDTIEYPGKFTACRLVLKKKSGGGKKSSTKVKFKGVAVLIQLARPVGSQIALKMERGSLGNWLGNLGSTYERVHLEDPVFENIFEVFGKDQVEARTILTPDVMELFLRLNFLFVNWTADLQAQDKLAREILANHNIEEVRDGRYAGLMANYRDDKLLLMIRTNEDMFEPVSLTRSAFDITGIRAVLYQVSLLNQLHAVIAKKR